jgi:hypothetical protein
MQSWQPREECLRAPNRAPRRGGVNAGALLNSLPGLHSTLALQLEPGEGEKLEPIARLQSAPGSPARTTWRGPCACASSTRTALA